MNNHLPIVFKICELMALDPVDTCLVLPQRTPSYITKAAELFGFKFHLTDASLIGDGIDFKAEPWIGVRADRQNWVKSLHVQDVLTALTPTANYGSRIFLSRRDTRCATNASELELYLSGKGFRTIFPEELSPADQIFIFREAEIIVAIHGAGLAPLLYAQPGGALTQLIEILHAGHMTDVYRVMAQQVGVSWIGVQGRLKPEYIRDAYAFENPFKTHSLDNFHVDLRALDIAFEHANVC
ncbi:MAG: glycosyltransferase 61 family protein [Pseudomonadota bacterium]